MRGEIKSNGEIDPKVGLLHIKALEVASPIGLIVKIKFIGIILGYGGLNFIGYPMLMWFIASI